RGELPPGVIDVRKYLTNDVLFDALMHFAYGVGGSNPVGGIIVGIKDIGKFFASTFQTNGSKDPNDIVGPAGFGPQGFVVPQATLPYRIDFQNLPEATGPAAEIVVNHVLDADLDLDTFELSDFGFGGINITVPSGRQFYS